MTGAFRDAIDMPIMQPYFDHWSSAAEIVSSAWRVKGRERTRLRAAIAHALSFLTWRSLCRDQKLSQPEAVKLMLRLTCECD